MIIVNTKTGNQTTQQLCVLHEWYKSSANILAVLRADFVVNLNPLGHGNTRAYATSHPTRTMYGLVNNNVLQMIPNPEDLLQGCLGSGNRGSGCVVLSHH